jgi:hypothetical protein
MNQEDAALAARLQAQLLQQSAVRIVDQTYKGRLGVTDPYDFAFANAKPARCNLVCSREIRNHTTRMLAWTESDPWGWHPLQWKTPQENHE